MRFVQHATTNKVFGAPAGWDQKTIPCGALPVTVAEEDGQVVLKSYWRPDAAELADLNAGKPIELVIFGMTHPVVSLRVEE